MEKKNNLKVNPSTNILITPGSDSGLFYAMMPFIKPGDEVIVPTPCYPNNIHNTELLHGTLVTVELKKENQYQIDIKAFENVLSEKTKMVVLTRIIQQQLFSIRNH